jgi:hypothetical protein
MEFVCVHLICTNITKSGMCTVARAEPADCRENIIVSDTVILYACFDYFTKLIEDVN